MKPLTPCIKVCKLLNNRCTGCKRTLDEIRDWSRYDDGKRIKIMSELQWRSNDDN